MTHPLNFPWWFPTAFMIKSRLPSARPFLTCILPDFFGLPLVSMSHTLQPQRTSYSSPKVPYCVTDFVKPCYSFFVDPPSTLSFWGILIQFLDLILFSHILGSLSALSPWAPFPLCPFLSQFSLLFQVSVLLPCSRDRIYSHFCVQWNILWLWYLHLWVISI